MQPLESEQRTKIDAQLELAGWVIQNYDAIDLDAAPGVAIREFRLSTGKADYLLTVNGEALGVLEAKRSGTLQAVKEQSSNYQVGTPKRRSSVRFSYSRIPFSYESNGDIIQFTNDLEPDARSRRVFHFHRPETLAGWAKLAPVGTPAELTELFRARVRRLPVLHRDALRECQYEAIQKLEQSLAENRLRSLVQMATGSGKTYMAISEIYRLLKHGGAKRVLFLVDRINLGQQTLTEFRTYKTPDTGRFFTEIYNVQLLTSNKLDPVADVCITTIQRLYSILRGRAEADPVEETSLFTADVEENEPEEEMSYLPSVPVEFFEVIFIDECHRSIYQKWRQVLAYFDAFQIGLTATPEQRAFGYFERNLVYEYSYENSVADGVNVDYQIFRIRTEITERGGRIEPGEIIPMRNKLTRFPMDERLKDELVYQGRQLDRDVVSLDQIRTVLMTYRDALFTQLFPGRHDVPKTLIFAKNDSHADDIVGIVREVFGKGNDFARKLTYQVRGIKPEELLNQFRNSYDTRILVSVDMVSTGTDIKPLEVLLFMRTIHSRTFFEQMKGRGCRTILDAQLQSVTPDAHGKKLFYLVDTVGITEGLRSDNPPLERRPTVPLDKLMGMIAGGNYDDALFVSLAGRLGRLTRLVKGNDERRLVELCGSQLQTLAKQLLDAQDAESVRAKAQELSGQPEPDRRQLEEAALQLAQQASAPFRDPAVRELVLKIQARDAQAIDTVNSDHVLEARFDEKWARNTVASFRAFMEQHKEQIDRFEQAYRARSASELAQVVEDLDDAMQMPRVGLSVDHIWRAYQVLDNTRVQGRGTKRELADIYALIRYTMQHDTDRSAILEPLQGAMDRRFAAWLQEQEQRRGRPFDPEQLDWLEAISETIHTNLVFVEKDFDSFPHFQQLGGRSKAVRLFGNRQQLNAILKDLNERLIA